MVTVRINSGLHGGSTPLSVNGRTVVEIPHDKDFPLSDELFQVLNHSNVNFQIVDAAPAAAATGEGVEMAPAPSPDATEIADLRARLAALELAQRTPAPEDAERQQEVMKEELAGGGSGSQETVDTEVISTDLQPVVPQGEQEQPAPESSDDEQPAAPADTGLGDLNGEPFDVDAVLAQPISKISEDLDELSPAQVDALIAAEQKADTPRTTLITALEKKRG